MFINSKFNLTCSYTLAGASMELVSLGVEKLWDRLSQEYDQFKGVEDQVTELKSNLNLLKSFLKDADATKHTNKMVRHCVEEIKEIVYDAEDIIETCILKENVGKQSGVMRRIKRFASTFVDRRELASDIRGISKRISKVILDMKRFKVQQMIADGSSSSRPLQERERDMRQEFARDYECNFVGLEANVKKLVGYLVEEDDIQIVSVTGMGGLGKTTVARQVFNHEDVKHHFDGLAWVCVSQDFTRKNVWQAIFRNLRPNEEEKKILEMTEATLLDKLSRLLETSRSLIVIDDIWKQEDWDLIKPIFPPKKGWTVLLTSRDESIAVRGDTAYINFKADYLTIDDSWTLFQRIAFPRKDTAEFKVDVEMEEMGKKMIKHCGGLPLAIKVLGGLLAEKYTSHDWRRLSENIGSHIVGITNEDYAINVGNLSYHWAAEEIPKPSYYAGATIRDVGDGYVEELVRRNMVTAKRDKFTSRFETLKPHDMMREVCLLKAKEENFLQIAGSCSSTADDQSSRTSRRFVSHSTKTVSVERDLSNPKLRSFVIVKTKGYGTTIDMTRRSGSSFTFSSFQLLRVLDLYDSYFGEGKLPSDIGKVIHLRYLSLEYTQVSHLPADLKNLKLLIYLNLNVSASRQPLFVPNVLMGMQKLRYLALPVYKDKKTKLELGNLVNLETLENFSTAECRVGDLRGMAKLMSLSIILNDDTSIETLSSSIGGLRHLERFIIGATCGPRRRMREEELTLGFAHLKHLTLRMYMPRLLDQQHFPSRLTFLDLRYCGLEDDPMPTLEKMLHLKKVSLRDGSFCGRKMVCSAGGFPELHELEVSRLEKWDEWVIEEGSMPLLHTLHIVRYNVSELPDDLRFITSLKSLTCELLGRGEWEWKKRVSKGGEDYYKVQHIPHVKITGDDSDHDSN
ncbi:hypothetical protein AXX17_AT1G52390 [Arabidopsis thaliana]|uniref:Uncharacterized protein n=1 Tax=Arabidopsis thaliana TaxID=3702 RepID=A0A178WCV6_ARATH|nr:hypothetical protein AXX17_AT1G52390 [Arabidopsis thaliana]